MNNIQKIKLKSIVGETIEGEIVKVEALSFYGEVNPLEGKLYDGRVIKDKILIIGRSRGSTVGSYVIYGLKYYGNAPKGIVMIKAEPIVIVGAIISGIPLFENFPKDLFNNVTDGCRIKIRADGLVEFVKCV